MRERKGLSAVELANRVGVTKGTISRYESGTRKFRWMTYLNSQVF
ncbi:helix-turn-helix transcriptional regulator [Bacillus licheniformis]|nr:helix-turn-helix transcriptional regulator [Bacillus licheniformis]